MNPYTVRADTFGVITVHPSEPHRPPAPEPAWSCPLCAVRQGVAAFGDTAITRAVAAFRRGVSL